MDFLMPRSAQIANTVKDLDLCNQVTGEYGLMLSSAQMLALAERRVQALQNTDRVEFGEGILKKLIFAFRDSPYLGQHDYANTIAELQDLFYYYKNETAERLSDDELIEIMKDAFDGKAQGSLEYLAGTALPLLCKELKGCKSEGEPERDMEDNDGE